MSKDKDMDQRLEEKEKIDAETERSLSIARMEAAHKQIQDMEKNRKRPALQSICRRIDLCLKEMLTTAKVSNQPKFAPLKLGGRTLIHFQSHKENYESIRADFQKVLEIEDEDIEKLFPKIDINITNAGCACSSVLNIVSQMQHMKIYCERLL